MEVTNRAATDLLDVRFVIDRGGDEREVARQSQVHPGRTFGGKVSLADIGVAGLPQDKRDAAAIINGLRPRVSLLFRLDGRDYCRTGEGDVAEL